MIDLYSWPTPNGHKVHIMLEECGLDYNVHGVDILKGDQFEENFLKISPNNKIPAIIDHDGPNGKTLNLFESGAILYYLAQKTGKFLPQTPEEHYRTMEWLMFQMGGLGPMLGQAHHFRIYAPEKIEYAYNRYTNEARRLYKVVNNVLSSREFIAGSTLTIADIAIFPWCRTPENQGVDISELPHFTRWFTMLANREKFQKGCAVLESERKEGPIDDKAYNIMFGDKQFKQN